LVCLIHLSIKPAPLYELVESLVINVVHLR
jgi:hypothetical protein